MVPGALSEAFRAAARGMPVDDEGDLEDALRARIDAGRAAWPELAMEEGAFVRHVASLVEGCLPAREHAADLWLVCACVTRVSGSASALERFCRPVVASSVARIDRGLVDDVLQAMLAKLLVVQGAGAPKIATFRARVPLRAWIRTIAVRTALNLKRNSDDKPHEPVSNVVAAATSADPAIEIARARYGKEVDRALVEALGTLDARARLLLKLHHGEGWSVDRLASRYHVGRSTAQRWVAAARAALLDRAKATLKERLGVTPSELESILVVVQSELQVSLLRLIEDGDERPRE